MIHAHVDFESKSELDLQKVGLHRYARHASTSPWCMAWAIGDAEPVVWVAGRELHTPLRRHVEAGGPVIAHNAPFELEIWNEICVPRYGFPKLHPEQVHCTMAMAYAMGLPGALEDAALALGLHMLKDAEGRALMLKYARPWRTEPTRWMDECPEFTLGGVKRTGKEGLGRLMAYCQQDVRIERELHSRVMPLSERERRVWLLDYKINQTGVAIDVESARAAIKLAEVVKAQCDTELARVTGGAVQAVTAVAALKEWIRGQGVEVDGLAKQDVVDLLAGTALPENVERALTLRQEAGKASTAKFDVMVERAGTDGRLRQMYQYHGAATGRWAARGVQPHNLVRDMPKAEAVETILELVRQGDHDAIDAIFGPPLTMLSRCLRSFFVAPPGKVLLSGDWSNVESRGAAWFAGEAWKLAAFRAQDNKTGPDVYRLGASRLLSIAVEEVTAEQRQAYGKVPDLAFQYQGGVGSGKVMGKTYGVKATDAEWNDRKEKWRAAHPRIVATWRQIQNAAINAVRTPGTAFACGYVGREAQFKMAGSFLWCRLPSGRVICFPYPKILEGEYGPQLTYMTVPDPAKPGKVIADPQNAARWARIATYGGALFNRVVQGFCRDFLADGMLDLDARGLMLVLHTHDDINGEIEEAKAERARALMQGRMRTAPGWAKDFPLYADVKVMRRYGK